MPEQNNIDKLFQDKLKGLKASPSPKNWTAIENKMAPKKRRVVPFWWFSGIAGILILGFFLFPFYEKQDVIVPNNSLENNFTSTEKETILNNIDTVFSKHLEKENTQLVEKEKINTNEKKKEYFNNKQTKPLKQEKEMSVKKIAMREKVFPENLAKNENQENENKTNHQQKEQTIVSAIAPKQQNQKNPETNSSENTIANKEINLLKEGSESESNNKNKKRKTWSISTNFALLNSGSFSNTSPFSENLSNTTEGKNSVAYGVQIGFKINKKWSIQSGVQLQELNFRNNNVLVTSSSTDVASVSFDGISEASIQSVAPSSSNADGLESFNLRSPNITSGNLSQQFGYIEIPVELKYTLNENAKLQTQLVGGFSSLFLTANNVLLNDPFSNRSGEASNLNTINFSSNLGVDFNYQFTKKWSFSVNPMLKTFLNTFSDKANGFSPFNLGVYSGVRYQF
jgi:outer membrane biosynthesis protein TonB